MTNNTQLLNCPFCGTDDVDPTGVLNGDETRSPECMGCGATAPTLATWNCRITAPAEDVRAVVEEPVGKVLSDAEMGIGYDRKFGRVIWFGPLEPGLLYRHPQRPVVLPERLREVWLFLDGQAELNGCVFGEKPEGRHNFWWRKELRAVLEELYPQQ